jgi:paraquat-inducible protein B
VTLRGVKIGTVSSMKVYLKLPDLVPVIPVYMEIEPHRVSWTSRSGPGESDLELAIRAGLRAQLATQSLVTGQVSINLDFYPNTTASLSDNNDSLPEIPTIPSDFQHIKDELADLKLPDLAEKARTALVGINGLIGELNGKIGPMADSLKQTSDTARVTLETTQEAVRQLQADASRTLGSIDHLASTTESQVQTAGKGIDKVTASADRAVTRADKVMNNLNDLTAPRSPMRDDLTAAIRDLAASASSLRNFSHDIERNPNSLLLGRASTR